MPKLLKVYCKARYVCHIVAHLVWLVHWHLRTVTEGNVIFLLHSFSHPILSRHDSDPNIFFIRLPLGICTQQWHRVNCNYKNSRLILWSLFFAVCNGGPAYEMVKRISPVVKQHPRFQDEQISTSTGLTKGQMLHEWKLFSSERKKYFSSFAAQVPWFFVLCLGYEQKYFLPFRFQPHDDCVAISFSMT